MNGLLIACLSSCLSLPVAAEAATATLTCRNSSGETMFTMNLQQEGERNTTAAFQVSRFSVNDMDASGIQTILDPSNGIFTLSVDGSNNPQYTYGPVKLWAIPSSFQSLSAAGEKQHRVYAFKAKLSHTGAKTAYGIPTSEVEVDCQLEYDL